MTFFLHYHNGLNGLFSMSSLSIFLLCSSLMPSLLISSSTSSLLSHLCPTSAPLSAYIMNNFPFLKQRKAHKDRKKMRIGSIHSMHISFMQETFECLLYILPMLRRRISELNRTHSLTSRSSHCTGKKRLTNCEL